MSERSPSSGSASSTFSTAMRSATSVRERVLGVDGVLVWVDPISGDDNRSGLDELLREVSSHGVLVGARTPDAIERMGTKEVLYRTKHLGWGSDVHLYASAEELEARLPRSLLDGATRLEATPRQRRHRRLERRPRRVDGEHPDRTQREAAACTLAHAAPRDDVRENVSLGEFIGQSRRWDAYFAGGWHGDRPAVRHASSRRHGARLRRLSPGRRLRASNNRIQHLTQAECLVCPRRSRCSTTTSRLRIAPDPAQERLDSRPPRVDGSHRGDLPLLWDADFLYGETDDTHILCEINVGSVLRPSPRAASIRPRDQGTP